MKYLGIALIHRQTDCLFSSDNNIHKHKHFYYGTTYHND